ncbi:MAG: class I SAM-dependent methyltransferase [Candidatus Thiodiazotropha sp. (ex Monitilora ramsayi)]|nr:class I SAM-dependent methyltransferase [Candidatus Thiodiazotropha sp. (ex Monitilora ramsayi)]
MLLEWIREKSFPVKAVWLEKVCHRLSDNPSCDVPSRFDIALLALAWGNIGYAAGLSYLRHVGKRAIHAKGTILECGSGATTLLIAALTLRSGTSFVVFEHNLTWYRYMRDLLDYLGFIHVTLVYAPLIDYADYRWYRIPKTLTDDDISLVVCDGPPGSNPGGRYGLLPTMQHRLTKDCVILLDDTHRSAEQKIIDIWRQYRCMKASRIGRFGTHSELVLC